MIGNNNNKRYLCKNTIQFIKKKKNSFNKLCLFNIYKLVILYEAELQGWIQEGIIEKLPTPRTKIIKKNPQSMEKFDYKNLDSPDFFFINEYDLQILSFIHSLQPLYHINNFSIIHIYKKFE